MNTFPIKIRNQSGLSLDKPIVITVAGIDSSIPDNARQQFFKANPDKNVWQDGQCSVTLSDLPKDSDGDAVLNMPFIESGVIYLSIEKELMFNGTSPPDFSNPSNPSYKTLFDKFEMTFLQKDGHPFIDTTNVDFFCFPLSLQESLTDGSTTRLTGFTKTRKQILDQFTSRLGDQWTKLIEKDDGNNIIRVVAPNKGLVPPNDFDAGFFQAYVDKAWNFYSWQGNTLTVDMTEIASENGQEDYKDVLFTGRVVTNPTDPKNQKFVFSGQSLSGKSLPDITFEKPTGDRIKASVFGCADLFDAPNKTPRSVPAKNLGAAFNVGVLALESGNLDLTPAGWKRSNLRQDFYTQTMKLSDGSSFECFNLYSKILHENAENGLVYGFAFDDVTGSDSTLSDAQARNAVVTIQNLT